MKKKKKMENKKSGETRLRGREREKGTADEENDDLYCRRTETLIVEDLSRLFFFLLFNKIFRKKK